MFLLVYVDQLPGTSFGAHVTGLFHGRSATPLVLGVAGNVLVPHYCCTRNCCAEQCAAVPVPGGIKWKWPASTQSKVAMGWRPMLFDASRTLLSLLY